MKGAVVLTDNHLMGKGICMDGFGGVDSIKMQKIHTRIGLLRETQTKANDAYERGCRRFPQKRPGNS